MKHPLILFVLALAFSSCNLSGKFRPERNSNEPGRRTSAATNRGDIVEHSVERPIVTAAQSAALSGGKEVKWGQQGMSWTVPPKWTEAKNETKMFVWHSPGSWHEVSLIVNISALAENFSADNSINGFYENAKMRAKNGELDEVKWLEIDGLKGLEFREADPEKPDDQRRLQWMAYRKFAGQVQLVNLMLATRAKEFPQAQDTMYAVLYSTKIVH